MSHIGLLGWTVRKAATRQLTSTRCPRSGTDEISTAWYGRTTWNSQDLQLLLLLAESTQQTYKTLLAVLLRIYAWWTSFSHQAMCMYADLAGIITGMLLEIHISEFLHMLESPEFFYAKAEVAEAQQTKGPVPAINCCDCGCKCCWDRQLEDVKQYKRFLLQDKCTW